MTFVFILLVFEPALYVIREGSVLYSDIGRISFYHSSYQQHISCHKKILNGVIRHNYMTSIRGLCTTVFSDY